MRKFKKYTFYLLISFMMAAFVIDTADAQIRRRKIRKNNKRMANFKGRKAWFPKVNRYNSVGITLNSFHYFGDLSPLSSRLSTDLSLTRPAVGVSFAHRFGPRYSLRGSFRYGTLRGDDYVSADPGDNDAIYRYIRNLHFRNRIKELSVEGVVDLFSNEATYISRVQWTPYIFAGIAVFHHNPQAYVNENSTLTEAGTWVDLEPLGTEGQYSDLPETAVNFGNEPYKLIQIAIPAGIGVRYRLNQILDFSFEVGTRYLFTDYIDDVSKNYVDPSVLNSDLAREMADRSQEATAAISGDDRNFVAINDATTDYNGDGFYDGFGTEQTFNLRGNKDDNDFYFVTTFRVAYILGSSLTRAKFR